jgi:negative regulator of replication initiation
MLNWQPDTYGEDRWSILNSSRVTHTDPALARYLTLLSALDAGWRVEPPIYSRADWSLKSRTRVFHFVLRRDSLRMTTLLSVPDCDAVRGLISENDWSVSTNES